MKQRTVERGKESRHDLHSPRAVGPEGGIASAMIRKRTIYRRSRPDGEPVRQVGTAGRWLGWAGRVFFGLAALALVGAIVGMIVSATVFSVPKGCEECTPHITVVLLAVMLFLASPVCFVVGIALSIASLRAARVQSRQRPRRRRRQP